MITRIEALNYRCLRYVSQPLKPFHVLVGPNASGKSTFLDVVSFLGRLVSDGLDAAVDERTSNFHDMVWGRENSRFELAVEASIPEEYRPPHKKGNYFTIRYEVAVGFESQSGELRILSEQLLLRNEFDHSGESNKLQNPVVTPASLFDQDHDRNWFRLIQKDQEFGILLQPEHHFGICGQLKPIGYTVLGRPTPKKAIFSQLNEIEFPAAKWLSYFLATGMSRIELDNRKLRAPIPPGRGVFFVEDGSNLPGVVAALQESDPPKFKDWINHLQTTLPNLEGMRVVERPEDRHRYLMLRYQGGLEVPSWMVSDGTLRLMALTLLPYMPKLRSIFLVEEPENSVHPLNIEAIMQSLKSVYDGQVLVTTHSPTVMAMTDVSDVLVFTRDEERGTTIVAGNEHPALVNWHGEVSLGTLFAGGVLG